MLEKALGVKQLLLLDMPNSSAFSKRMKSIKGIYLKELYYQLFIFRYSDFFYNVNIFQIFLTFLTSTAVVLKTELKIVKIQFLFEVLHA